MTTASAWLSRRDEDVPAPLALLMREAVGESTGGPDALSSAAEQLLRRALSAEPMTRAQALDVLGADALVTYAFEAAADDPQTLVAHTDSAMRRIASLAGDDA